MSLDAIRTGVIAEMKRRGMTFNPPSPDGADDDLDRDVTIYIAQVVALWRRTGVL